MWFFFILLAGVLLASGSAAEEDDLIVSIQQGKLQGAKQNLLDGSTYYSFKGIPYAQPPLGDLRFRAPLPPTSWSGIRSATEHGSKCPQYFPPTNEILPGSEDCLFLNVYTKSLQPDAKIPVMFFIHGGAYMAGAGDTDIYGPEFLLQHDVILVTLNYRLEVLGFLSLDTSEVPGNAGMKDQVLALRWVKQNIAKFGGDPDNVTIFGQSALSAAVTFHLLSPMSKGLFHKAIAQSGVAIQDWNIATGVVERAFRVGKVLGKETTDTQELLQFLRSVPAVNLTKISVGTQTEDEKLRGLPMHFVPCVEKIFHDVDAFLTDDPIHAVANPANAVPLMIGYNSEEGLLLIQDQLAKAPGLNANSSYLVPRELVPKLSKDMMEDIGKRIMDFYMGDKGMGNDTFQGIFDMCSDMYFAYNTHRFVSLYSSKAPVYMFRFDFSTDLNILKNLLGLGSEMGACHSDNLYYLFYNELNKEVYLSNVKLQRIVRNLTKLWADFAKTSNPTPDSHPKWPLYTPAGGEYMVLNEVLTPSSHADAYRIIWWNTMYCEAGLTCIAQSNI